MTSLLRLDQLGVTFATPDGAIRAVDAVSLDIKAGETLGVVGESGSGKSQTFLAVMGLLAQNGRAEGRVLLGDRDLLTLSKRELNAVRGQRIAMVFQDPMTSLNPYLTIGRQLTEVLEVHRGIDAGEARRRAIAMLERCRIPEATRRLGQYPHEFSGGMRQRAMIAMALLTEPELLIADEPTTALDVTVQAQILDLMAELVRESHTALVLITHDLGAIAGLADRVAVMYAGRVAELGPVHEIFARPSHPYTQGLLRSLPRLDEAHGRSLFESIPGQPPDLRHLPPGCAFQPRCTQAHEACRRRPDLALVQAGHSAACWLARASA
jgi:oligopeptide transport system ATP-binding protein